MITCYFENSKTQVNLRHVVVDALMINGKKILLVKRGPGSFIEVGKWALPGGYMEMNETCEQAVIREVREETGYDCEVIKLFRLNDNPKRPVENNRQNVSVIYLVKPLEKIGAPDHEVSEIKWFDLDNLPSAKNMAFDHLDTIKLYKIYLKNRFRLPITNMTHDDIEGWEETLEIMSNPKLMAAIKKGRENIKHGRVVPLEKVLKDLGLTEKDLKKKNRQGVYK